jgi:hypothetical protein
MSAHPAAFAPGAYVSPASGAHWQVVIGLECHVQLATRTKLFCGCEVRFGAPPNSLTCPVCTAQPGVLPVLNREALALAVRVALAIGAEVPERSKFDRKHYFYCDLPKGYQISQYDQPYCRGGGIALSSGRVVRLARIHLEEDAGKAIHDRGDMTLVDLNRAGVPLVEAVTEADLTGADEAVEYLAALKEILQYTGASDCDMEKGELRCDVNVSVRRARLVGRDLARDLVLDRRGLRVGRGRDAGDAPVGSRPRRDAHAALEGVGARLPLLRRARPARVPRRRRVPRARTEPRARAARRAARALRARARPRAAGVRRADQPARGGRLLRGRRAPLGAAQGLRQLDPERDVPDGRRRRAG